MEDIRACSLVVGIDAIYTRDWKWRREGSEGVMILKSWETLGFGSYMEAYSKRETVEIFLDLVKAHLQIQKSEVSLKHGKLKNNLTYTDHMETAEFQRTSKILKKKKKTLQKTKTEKPQNQKTPNRLFL